MLSRSALITALSPLKAGGLEQPVLCSGLELQRLEIGLVVSEVLQAGARAEGYGLHRAPDRQVQRGQDLPRRG